jgi:hypothetical protein
MLQDYTGSWNQPFSPPPQEHRQYSQGPQGDPFAPPPPSFQLPPDPEQEARRSPPKPMRKKRKPRKEEECGFCQGNDEKNKKGERELMVTCDECSRSGVSCILAVRLTIFILFVSGHPSCMALDEVSNVIRSYPWKCMECKNCEICQEKGDDVRALIVYQQLLTCLQERILFCDSCDRGSSISISISIFR